MDVELAIYRSLFVHRDDVFAQQHADGSYRPVKRTLEDIDIQEHMAGFASYGVYVIDPIGKMITEPGWTGAAGAAPNTVKYVVFDLDTYDESALDFLCGEVAALCLSVHLDDPDARLALLLESSGGKGYHIWMFFEEPVTAAQARYFAAPVKEAYDDANRAGDGSWPALEVFPKQDEVPEGGYGNLVKLPLGVHAKSGKRSEFLGYQGWANDVSTVRGLPVSLLPKVPADYGHAKHNGAGRVAPFACISKLIEEGAPQGCRDKAMFHFAHYAFGTGMPEDMVHEWAERVNMQFDPPLTDFEVDQKVDSASRMASPHPGCNADWLDGFCPGGPTCFAPWNKDRPGRKERVTEQSEELSREQWLAQRRQRR